MYQTSVNQEKIQIINRVLILSLIRQEGICSRATLAKLSGLRQATITNIIGELIHCGLVVETGLISGERNRRAIGVRLNDERFKVIGVRLARGKFDICLAGLSGKPHGIWRHRTDIEGNLPSSLRAVRLSIQDLIREHPDSEILSVCVAVPGPYHEGEDRLLFVTGMNGWKGCAVHGTLSEGLSVPLQVINDANAGAFAQFWYSGGGVEAQNMVYILAGQGIGCGMLVDGKLLLGQQSIAGEFGHSSIYFDGAPCTCGNRGCLEQYCSVAALQEQIVEQLRNGASSCLREGFITVPAIAQAVRAGDRVACEAYRRVCGLLAMGIVGLINQLNPGKIIVGDQLAEIHSGMMLDAVKRTIDNSVNPLISRNMAVEINRLKESPSLLGAAAYAAQQALSTPDLFLAASARNRIVS
ncbi:ROK family transcriptional regulator [Clostridium sp. D33t1_170424_F3]|uniref:ROK family transcriptional regulator n=1 Tax=Clostridium sp. D33t1_170424_F3 TaxID=2787099 RepID=UPI0018AA4A97|nr:ROK family transcriptional regulator [Clostridium sp. D33t1_170424_F3]